MKPCTIMIIRRSCYLVVRLATLCMLIMSDSILAENSSHTNECDKDVITLMNARESAEFSYLHKIDDAESLLLKYICVTEHYISACIQIKEMLGAHSYELVLAYGRLANLYKSSNEIDKSKAAINKALLHSRTAMSAPLNEDELFSLISQIDVKQLN